MEGCKLVTRKHIKARNRAVNSEWIRIQRIIDSTCVTVAVRASASDLRGNPLDSHRNIHLHTSRCTSNALSWTAVATGDLYLTRTNPFAALNCIAMFRAPFAPPLTHAPTFYLLSSSSSSLFDKNNKHNLHSFEGHFSSLSAGTMAATNLSCSAAAAAMATSRSQELRCLKWINGLHPGNPFVANRNTFDFPVITTNRRSCVRFTPDGRIRATVVPGEGDLLSYQNGNKVAGQAASIDEWAKPSGGVEIQSDAIAFATLSAEIAPTPDDFFVDNDEDDCDLDFPTEGFASISAAIEDIRQGKMVIVVDDEDRENEGDLIMAASLATPEAMAFIVKHGTGIVCVSMKEEGLERLDLPLMVTHKENEEKLRTAFTVTVDAKHGTTTGVSAQDRATTVLALASRDSKPEDFNRPGHIFPLKYREGGVLKRAGHTEASVDLALLAGLEPVAVLCEIVDDDGSMARLPKLREFAQRENLKIISIADLVRYRRKRDKLVERSAAAPIPTMWGPFKAYCYKSVLDGIEHIAMVHGDIGDGQDILVRVHSECLTGDIFGSARCDCGNQLALAMKQIEAAGRGVLVYLRGHEGRGIGLGHKLRAYNLQDDGRDTVEANEELGLPVDSREYGIGAQILRDLGVRTMKLMTNNPMKYSGLKGYGLSVVGRVPLLSLITMENKRYLETKRTKMGHVYGPEYNGNLTGLASGNGAAVEHPSHNTLKA